jgi:hypothetical protein
MGQLTDPTPALQSLQQVMNYGALPPVQPGALHPVVYLIVDEINDQTRFTYFTFERRTITAFAMLAHVEPMRGLHSFQLGCAVPRAYRRQGRGVGIVRAAIDEFSHGFGRMGAPAFMIEAIVSLDNVASQRIAAATIDAEPKSITDAVSGLPALHYVRRVDPKPRT